MFHHRSKKPASSNSGHNRSRAKGSSSKSKSGTNTGVSNSISFLFVVNELHIDGHETQHDQWNNRLPPTTPHGYDDEEPSVVFRCSDGVISQASNYAWARSSVDDGGLGPGNIFIFVDLNNGQPLEDPEKMPVYNVCTIFSCNPQLPIVAVSADATIDTTMYHGSTGPYGPIWATPQFIPHATNPGTSEIILDANQGQGYVIGRDASWIPSLLPSTFKNSGHAPSSTGLSGDLAAIIGLMAFYERRGNNQPRTNELFLGGDSPRGMWHQYRWRGSGRPHGYATFESPLRGFLVYICLDNKENANSTFENLQWLEEENILVQENPSQ